MKSKEVQLTPYGFIDASRTIRKLSEVCVPKDGIQTGPFGSQLHSSDYVEDGIPIITVEHLGENIIEGKKPPLVNADDVQRLVKYTLKEGDIVFSRVGSVDRRALVTKAQNGWMFSGRLLRVRPEPELVDSRYLSYFFGLPMFKTYIRSIAVGATMPSLNTGLLSDVPVILPGIREQQVIGKVLSTLDEKIRINNELSKTLEDTAQTIFKSWFIHFDPVKARLAGEKPDGMDAATAALFPDSMEESELGLIPSGWDVKSAIDLFEIGIGRTPPRKETEWFCDGNTGLPWVSIRDMGTFETFSHATSQGLTQAAVQKFKVPVVPENTVLMSFKLTVGKLCITDRQMVTNEAIAHFRISQNSPLDTVFTYLWLSNLDMDSLDSTSSIGTATNSGVIKQIKFLVPPQEIIRNFQESVSPVFSQLRLLRQQTTNLVLIRDSLLPRLISGQLQIPQEMLAS
jgi:type I restriction enzyme S subunit